MAAPELPRTENQRHSMANDGSVVIVPAVPVGTRVNINLNSFIVIIAVLCCVKRLLLIQKKGFSVNASCR